MPNLPNFEIPAELTPDTFCLCLQIPNDPTWIHNFVGLLAQPTYWFNWQRDEDKSGKILAQYWTQLFDEIDWSVMSCCCEPPLIQINSDGSVSVSTDGGSTYHTDNNQDPRYTLPQSPPLSGTDGDDKKCKAANNIVRQMKDIQAGNAAAIGSYSTLAAMAAQIVALAVLVFFDPALIPFLVGLFFELAAALLATTADSYNALFTDDDWGWILCEVYCKMTPAGQIPASEFVNIQADFDSHFSGNAALTFSAILNAWQLPGINQAAKMPTTDNLDCSSCCPACVTGWENGYTFEGTFFTLGTIVDSGADFITVQSFDRGDGRQEVPISQPFTGYHCCSVAWEFVGTTYTIAKLGCNCETQPSYENLVENPLMTSPVDATALLFINETGDGSGVMTIKFTFSDV